MTRPVRFEMRPKVSLMREYNRIQKARRAIKDDTTEELRLQGALQAIAWVMRDFAQAPSKAFAPAIVVPNVIGGK